MRRINHFLSRFSLLIALLMLIGFFSLIRPDSFATLENAGSIMSDGAVLSLIAVGVMVPMIVGQFDVAPGFIASLGVMLTAGLQSNNQWPWPLVLVAVLAIGALIGLLMGVLVGYLQLNSLVVSLGVGSVLSGIVLVYSGGQVIYKGIPPNFLALGQTRLLGFVPLPFLYALAIAAVMWFVLTYRPAGRRLYAVGGGPDAAKLIGVNLSRYIAMSFVVSSTLASLAGFVQVARLGAGHPTAAQAFLLPAFAAAFLSATSFRLGFYNIWGAFLAVYLVGTGTTGLFMLGADSYVQPVFNGVVLVGAVTLARVLILRRNRRLALARAGDQQNVAPLERSTVSDAENPVAG
ncbi:monosaccharide ABC transporter membrane protein (CUT2 family) [Trinickia symbiotica]|uniref:ABC transporter permease n=1 Tax=Trinickia symbiotica TaxID=863227 RepID=A0A2N7X6D3_9BURK|nr:ABC transporter permease [Trinickia symbiotica]PMS37194.1 ABC transporter permease [Trinickia symbiotica]PPK42736.1 monosaccharide ABC transporter membrane protein (CUT2 family) [Trinickia symbiotica]